MTEQSYEGEVVRDAQIYEGEPDYDAPVTNENADQDDEVNLGGGLGLFARPALAVNDRQETLQWYATHQNTSQIGFNPDGMCMKVVRTARNIGPVALTAKISQDNTPSEYRVHDVRDLRKSMPLYFDDPNDSNRAGHVVTMIGRVPNFDPDNLGDILVETNSVKAGELVIVRGDYFFQHWGDSFQFGAKWLNGRVLETSIYESKIERFNDGGPVYNLKLLDKAAKDRPAAASARDEIDRLVKKLPDSPSRSRVREFKVLWKDQRKLNMALLDAAVDHGRGGTVKHTRDEIRRLIDQLPDV